MSDFETKVITDKSQIQDKIAEAERRSREWEEKQVELWPTNEEDMQACVQIMMMGFAFGGGPQPAVREVNGQRVYAPWVAQVKDYCLQKHGTERGEKIFAKVMERLEELSASMAGSP